jgi:hypothetical protein
LWPRRCTRRRPGFGEVDFYPNFVTKAAVLVVRLAKNHPLPDGNKHTAWVALRVFVDVNGWSWEPMPTSMKRSWQCWRSPPRVRYHNALGPTLGKRHHEPPDTTTGGAAVCTGTWLAGCRPLAGVAVCACGVGLAVFASVWP